MHWLYTLYRPATSDQFWRYGNYPARPSAGLVNVFGFGRYYPRGSERFQMAYLFTATAFVIMFFGSLAAVCLVAPDGEDPGRPLRTRTMPFAIGFGFPSALILLELIAFIDYPISSRLFGEIPWHSHSPAAPVSTFAFAWLASTLGIAKLMGKEGGSFKDHLRHGSSAVLLASFVPAGLVSCVMSRNTFFFAVTFLWSCGGFLRWLETQRGAWDRPLHECRFCGYDLRGTHMAGRNQCPECGRHQGANLGASDAMEA